MTIKVTVKTVTTLTLSDEHLAWLKGQMQNSHHNDLQQDIEMREEFWVALGGNVITRPEDDMPF